LSSQGHEEDGLNGLLRFLRLEGKVRGEGGG
jgi:hypothetical protein